MQTGEPIVAETEAETRDGKKIPIQAACSALFDKEGKPYGGMEVIIDISEVKKLQREADEQRKYLERQAAIIAESLAAFSSGDLTISLNAERDDEMGRIINSLNKTVKKLREIVCDVKVATDNVAAGSQELSATAEEMSQGVTEQAASAEESSTSMEQMISNVRQSADNSRQTEKIAIKSSEDAEEGGKAVEEAVSAMKQIAEKINIEPFINHAVFSQYC